MCSASCGNSSPLETEICDRCKQGRIVLPGYTGPKTVCVQCWRRLVIPPAPSWSADFGAATGDQMEAEFTKLAMAATEFLAKGGFFYSWEMVRQHIVNGYFVYQKVLHFYASHG